MTTSLIQFHKTDNTCHYELIQEGKKCQFLQFLINTSNFTWRKMPEEVTEEDKRQEASILLSKLCAIGYLIFRKETGCFACSHCNRLHEQSTRTEWKNLICEFHYQVHPSRTHNW